MSIHRVGLDHGVAHFHGDVEDQAGHGGAHQRGARLGVGLRHAVADHFQGVLGGGPLFLGLVVLLEHFVVFVVAHQVLVVQGFLTLQIGRGLLEVDVGQTHAALGGAQRVHVGNDLQLGDHLVLLHRLSRLLVEFGDDAVDLRLDVHLVARHDLARDHGAPLYVGTRHGDLLILQFLWFGIPEQEEEGSEEHNRDQRDQNVLENAFHIVCYSFIIRLSSHRPV